MKNCYYDGDLQKDINIIKESSFDIKKFLVLTLMSVIAAIIGCGIVSLIIGKITTATIGSFIGILTVNTFKNANQSKKEKFLEERKLINLYNEINDECSNKLSDELAKSKIKDCIVQTQKISDVKRDSKNKIISKTEKIIKYFYLLDPTDKIKVLKQINEVIKVNGEKEENINLYLLEAADIKEEIDEIPVEKTLKLKDSKKDR